MNVRGVGVRGTLKQGEFKENNVTNVRIVAVSLCPHVKRDDHQTPRLSRCFYILADFLCAVLPKL